MKSFAFAALSAALVFVATSAFAQSQGSMDHKNMQGMSGMGNMMGMHVMPATVTAIDSKTGLVDVTAGSMALKVHFPPASLAALKAGDKITLHLGFNKQ